nr:MAG TPA: hypothetical protein [Caudoviricetes sp.]
MRKGTMKWQPLAPRYSVVLAHRQNAKCISVV